MFEQVLADLFLRSGAVAEIVQRPLICALKKVFLLKLINFLLTELMTFF